MLNCRILVFLTGIRILVLYVGFGREEGVGGQKEVAKRVGVERKEPLRVQVNVVVERRGK